MHSPLSKSLLLLGTATGAILLAAAACGSSGASTSATIGPAGGTLALTSPAVTLTVPPGAVTTPTTLALEASVDGQSAHVTLTPDQLALRSPAALQIELEGAHHIASVSERSGGEERSLPVESRIETPNKASTRMKLDRLTRVHLSLEHVADGGTLPAGACREHEEGRDDDGHADGGTWTREPGPVVDGGVPMVSTCPTGFECDDGVCVAPGGNDEDEDGCHADGGVGDDCHGRDGGGETRDGGR